MALSAVQAVAVLCADEECAGMLVGAGLVRAAAGMEHAPVMCAACKGRLCEEQACMV